MAWNEPGNNGNDKDPWNNKGGKDQGPPDLDEVMRKFGNKFGGLFGGNKPGKSGGGLGGAGISFILIIAVIVWALSGIYTVKEAERGIVLQFGQYNRIAEPGLRWKMTFIERVLRLHFVGIAAKLQVQNGRNAYLDFCNNLIVQSMTQ